MGNFGTPKQRQVIEAFDSNINVTAQGNIELGTVVNPTIGWDLGYSQNSSVSLTAVTGNVTISGEGIFNGSNFDRVLPATLTVSAGGNIFITNSFALAPSPTGTLSLIAAGDIDGQYNYFNNGTTTLTRSSIILSDLDPNQVYGSQPNFSVDSLFNNTAHEAYPNILHQNDTSPIVISAGRDLKNIEIDSPKRDNPGRPGHQQYLLLRTECGGHRCHKDSCR